MSQTCEHSCRRCFNSLTTRDERCSECGHEVTGQLSLKSSSNLVDEKEHERSNSRVCELCLEEDLPGGTPVAVQHCIDCAQDLCLDCCAQHRKTKATKTHRLEVISRKPVCDACSEEADSLLEETALASKRCEQCEQNLCDRCCKAHGKIKATKTHTLIPLLEKVDNSLTIRDFREDRPAPDNGIKEDEAHITMFSKLTLQGRDQHEESSPETKEINNPTITIRRNKIYLTEKVSMVVNELMNNLRTEGIISVKQLTFINRIRDDLKKSNHLLEILQLNDSSLSIFVKCLRNMKLEKLASVMQDGGMVVQIQVKYKKRTDQQSLVNKLNNLAEFRGPKKAKVSTDIAELQLFGLKILESEQRRNETCVHLWFSMKSTFKLSTLKTAVQSGALLEVLSKLFKHLLYAGKFSISKFIKPESLEFDADRFESKLGDDTIREATVHVPDENPQHHEPGKIETRMGSMTHSMQAKAIPEVSTSFMDFLSAIRMGQYYPRKLSWVTIITVTERNNLAPDGFRIIDKLMMLDYRAPLALCPSSNESIIELSSITHVSQRKFQKQPSIKRSSKFHPMDVMNVIYNCCDTIFLQTLMEKMFMCQLGLPILFPDVNEQTSTLSLWSLRGIAPECMQTENDVSNQSLVTYPHQFFSFMRFGHLKCSKSKLLNDILRKPSHDTFYHRDCRNGSVQRLFSNGTVEAAWSLPSSDMDPGRMFCTLNLRGESTQYVHEAALISSVSSLSFLLFDVTSLKQKNYVNFVRACGNIDFNCVIFFFAASQKDASDHSDDIKSCVSFLQIYFKIYTTMWNWDEENENTLLNEEEVMGLFKDIIAHRLEEKVPRFTLEDLAALARTSTQFRVDEDDEQCSKASRIADKSFGNLAAVEKSKWKSHSVPLQGNLWREWSKIHKEMHRIKNVNEAIENVAPQKESELRGIRFKQFQLTENPCMDFVKGIASYLLDNRNNYSVNQYFLMWMKMRLDSWSRMTLPQLKQRYEVEYSRRNSSEEDADGGLIKIQKEIESASFGLEHIFREFGQLYEATNVYLSYNNPSTTPDGDSTFFMNLPDLMADLVLKGFPLELMDGDAGFVPVTWIRAVFGKIGEQIGENAKMFVVSAVGIQSSGKSTLLNAMFGLKFAVSAGRCTKGVFCQMIPVDKEGLDVNFDYILVIDTEGLRAPELTHKSHIHDNELATFVVGLGNTTIINMRGENFDKMEDILQIVIHAMIRIKYQSRVQLHPSCIFIHQNVSAYGVKETLKIGRQNSVRLLDQVTKAAADQEKLGDNINSFKDVIDYDDTKHSVYFPDLWLGRVPMAPVSDGYSESVNKVKQMLLKEMSTTANCVTSSSFVEKLSDLWRSILQENFVFSFKNSEEIKAFSMLDDMISNLLWRIKTESLKLHHKLSSEILSCQPECDMTCLNDSLKLEIEEWMLETSKAAEQELEEHFENSESREIIEQWKGRYFRQLKETCMEEKECIQREIMECISLRVMQVSNNDSIKSFTDELIKIAKHKATEMKSINTKMNKQELIKCFKESWKSWISNKGSTYHHTDPAEDVLKAVRDELFGFFKAHQDLLKKRLDETPLKELEGFSFKNFPIVDFNDLQWKPLEHREKLKAKQSDISSPSLDKRCLDTAKMECNGIFLDIKKYVISLSKHDFKSGYVSKIIQMISKFFSKFDGKKKQAYEYQHPFRIRFTVHILKCAANEFIQMRIRFREKNDPLAPEKEHYNAVYQLFKNAHKESANANDEIAAKIFPDLFIDWVQQTVESDLKRQLVNSVVEEEDTFESKTTFITAVLSDLGETKMFTEFVSFLENREIFWTNVIQNIVDSTTLENNLNSIIEKEAERFLHTIITAIRRISHKSYHSLREYSKDLQYLLKRKIFCPAYDGAIFDNFEVSNFSRLSECLVDLIPPLIPRTIKSIKTEIKVDKVVNEVIEILLEKVKGCPEECPFCKSPCCMTVKGHPGDHRALQHYPIGVAGFFDAKSKKLLTCNCHMLITTDLKFAFNQEIPDELDSIKNYRKYRTNWEIQPDRSSELSLYWKWMFAQFNKELAKHHHLEPADIPAEWHRITWEQAKHSLRETQV